MTGIPGVGLMSFNFFNFINFIQYFVSYAFNRLKINELR